jgi:hypothetical protein
MRVKQLYSPEVVRAHAATLEFIGRLPLNEISYLQQAFPFKGVFFFHFPDIPGIAVVR